MRTGGLKRSVIAAIGAVVGLLVIVGVYFAVIQPDQKNLEDIKNQTDQYEQKAATKKQAEALVVAAQVKQATKRVALLKYENKYMRIGPDHSFLSMKDPQKAMIVLWKEQANIVGPLISGFIRKSGVKLLTPIVIPGAPVDPNMINPNEYQLPLGQVQVSGTFGQINRFLRSLANSPRLIRVNNVELAGTSPNVVATTDLTLIVLPRDSGDFKQVPLATGDATGGGGGGFGPAGGGYSPPAGANGPNPGTTEMSAGANGPPKAD